MKMIKMDQDGLRFIQYIKISFHIGCIAADQI